MGLDMYLYGEKSVSSRWDNDPQTEDGFVLESKRLSMGYWRKHANLHGWIVKTFANGVDECQEIPLYKDSLQTIINALEKDEIYEEGPVTGFFFGRSEFPGDEHFSEQKQEDLDIFRKAYEWTLKAEPASGSFGEDNYKSAEWRAVVYQASW
jgi:hypothetical protein